jgi:ribosome maturation factor RimP
VKAWREPGKWAQSARFFYFPELVAAEAGRQGRRFYGRTEQGQDGQDGAKVGRKEDILGKVRAIAEPLAEGEGLELVDAELGGGHGGGTVLRLFIDRKGGTQAVSLDDCSGFSRVVSTALDVEDPVQGAYDLEVSSPGLDRPLRKAEHFQKYAGQRVKVKTFGPIDTAGARKSFTGKLLGLSGDQVRIDVDGTVFDVPLSQISKANIDPVFEF